MPPTREPGGRPPTRKKAAARPNRLAGVSGSGNAGAGVSGRGNAAPRKPAPRPVPRAKPKAGPKQPPALAFVVKAQKQAKTQRTARGGKDDKSSADLKRGDVYKKSTEYKRSLALAALAKQGRTPAFRDITIGKDDINGKPVVNIKHRRKYQLDANEQVSLASLLNGKGVQPAGMTKAIGKLGRGDASGIAILGETLRPIHAVAGAADAAVQGKSLSEIGKAASRGIQNKDKKLFSDVLKTLGAPKAVQSALGLTLDIALDPTTYLTGGASAVGKGAASKAGAQAAAQAARGADAAAARAVADSIRKSRARGASDTVARAAAAEAGKAAKKAHLTRAKERGKQAAARKQATYADKGRGIDIRFAGKSVPGVTRATAKTGKGIKAVAAQAPQPVKKAGRISREGVREVRPTLAPAGANKAQFAEAQAIAREARAGTNAGAITADREARGLAARIAKLEKQHGPTVKADVIHAIETGKIGTLPVGLQQTAREIRDHYKHMKRLRTRAGIREGTIKNGRYFPHAREDALHARMGIVEDATTSVAGASTRRTGPSPEGSGRRTDIRPLREASADRVARGESKFSTDIPLVTSNYASSTARAVAENNALKQLASIGRPYKVGDTLKAGEAVYHLGYSGKNSKFGLRPVKDGEARRNGKYVVLEEKVVDTTMARMKPAIAETMAGRGFDRMTGGFKRIATFTPGFHIRNAIGDTQMAYLSQPGRVLPRNTAQAIKANRANVALEKAQAKSLGAKAPVSGKTIKVAGERMPIEQFVAMAQKLGVTQSGQISRELADLAGAALGNPRVGGRVSRGARKATDPISRGMRGRENVTRLSTFKHGLDGGMTPREAANFSLGTHIDYGLLTTLERKAMRRAMPFYTFSARAIPFHAEKLITNPGKFAAYAKIIDEGAKAAGLEDGWWNGASEFHQRAMGVPLKVNGDVVLVSAGLPMQMLNELPTSTSPGKYADEILNYVAQMTTPIVKSPIEFWQNYSFFFRDKIEQPNRPLVSAPRWVKALPRDAQKKLGVTSIYDPKLERMVPGWPAKTNYIAKSIPGPVSLIQNLLTEGTSKRNQGTAAKIIGAAGIKVDDYDPAKVALDNSYELAEKIKKERAKVKQQVGPEYKDSVEYQRLSQELKQVEAAREMLSGQAATPTSSTSTKRAPVASGGWGHSSGGSPRRSSGSSSGGWGHGGGSSAPAASSSGGWGHGN